MPNEFRFLLTDEFDIAVERDDSGDLFVERDVASRAAWMVLGLFVVCVCGWFVLRYDGGEGWFLSTATPALIALSSAVGVVAEPLVGSDRSGVVEADGAYYLEMMTSSRWYVAAASVGVLGAGVSLFLDVRAPGAVDAGGRRRGVAALVESLPFGEFVVLAVAVAASLWLLNRVRTGRMRIRPT